MADPEHLALIRSGVDAVNKLAREQRDLEHDLEGADLRGLDLRNVRLLGARLTGADLEGADLRHARLNSADMRDCNLRGADLRGTGLHRADLTGADLRGARFDTIGVSDQRVCISPASFQGVHWDREKIEHILELINLNPDWKVRWELVAKKQDEAG